MADTDGKKNRSNQKTMATVRLGLLVLSLTTAGSLATPYSSASSCCGDCGCNGGSALCCTLANGASCWQH
jgi:hypothetical protein